MRVLLRADASEQMGSGHVMRCLALAEGLAARGHHSSLVSAALPERIRASVEARGLPVTALTDGHSSQELGAVADRWQADWVVFDGYGFDDGDLRSAKDHAHVLCIADDASLRAYGCDIVLNQNAYATARSYAGRSIGRLLVGPRFALLRSEFGRYLGWTRATPQRASRILVTLGGSDPAGISEAVVRDVRTAVPDAAITAVVGAANSRSSVLADLGRMGRVDVVHATADMAGLMSHAHLAVSSAGSTTAELAFMQLPAVLLVIADNQRTVAAAVETAGTARVAGEVVDGRALNQAKLREIVAALAGDPGTRAAMARAGRALVDGRGARRVVQAMEGVGLTVRAATMEDATLLHAWSNDPLTRAASFHSDPIPMADHVAWLDEQLGDPDSLLLVGELGGAAGHVRFKRIADEAIISVSVAPAMRGRGLAAALVDAGVSVAFERWPVARIRAEIRRDNERSTAAFADAGFGPPSPHPARDDAVVMWRMRSDESGDQRETR